MNSPNLNRSPGMEEGKEENGKDWSKDESSKASKSPPQPQAPQQMMIKGENYNQFVMAAYQSNFKDPMRPESTLGTCRLDVVPRFDSNNPRVEQMTRAEPPTPRFESSHRLEGVTRYPLGAHQRLVCPPSDIHPPKKKPRGGAAEDDDSDPNESSVSPLEGPDDNDAFGRVVASQLRSMSKIQKCIAQRLISEVCFRGQLQYLQPTSSLSSQQPQVQQQQVYNAARQAQRYVRSGQEIAYLHPQALRQVIQPAVSSEYHNVQQAHPEQTSASINPMESYNL